MERYQTWKNDELIKEIQEEEALRAKMQKVPKFDDYKSYKIYKNTVFRLNHGEIVDRKTGTITAYGKNGTSTQKVISEVLEVLGQNKMFASQLKLNINNYVVDVSPESTSDSVYNDFRAKVKKRHSGGASEEEPTGAQMQ